MHLYTKLRVLVDGIKCFKCIAYLIFVQCILYAKMKIKTAKLYTNINGFESMSITHYMVVVFSHLYIGLTEHAFTESHIFLVKWDL